MPHARDGALVIFGIRPDQPRSGYGYIEAGRRLDNAGVEAVQRFVEKPDAATAREYMQSGRHYWNSGIFLFRAETFLRELEALAPEMLLACRQAVSGGSAASEGEAGLHR